MLRFYMRQKTARSAKADSDPCLENTSAAKAGVENGPLTARLKPCPSPQKTNSGVFQQPVKPCRSPVSVCGRQPLRVEERRTVPPARSAAFGLLRTARLPHPRADR